MTKHIILLFSFLVALASTRIHGQENAAGLDTMSMQCYSEHIDPKYEESVFTKIEIPPSFKGGSDAFLSFLFKEIDFSKIVAGLPQQIRSFTDSAVAKFIISKKGILSDLTVEGATKEAYKQELLRVIKASSCRWEPGNFSGRYVNGWTQIKIFYTINRRSQDISVKVSYENIR